MPKTPQIPGPAANAEGGADDGDEAQGAGEGGGDATTTAAPATKAAGKRVKVPGGQPPAATTTAAPAAAPVTATVAPQLYAAEVDPKTIRGPVLTRQGWVVPDESAQRQAATLR